MLLCCFFIFRLNQRYVNDILKAMKKKYFIIPIFILLPLVILVAASAGLTTTCYTYESARIPEAFDGFRIVVLSDIHCKSFGKNNEKFIRTINDADPNLILILGDNVDSWHKNDLTPLDKLFAGIADTAPIYAVSGNHECANPQLYAQLLTLYEKYSITDLDDSELFFSYQNSSIVLKGLGAFDNKINWDKDFLTNHHPDTFTILLDHYPQLNRLAAYGYDLILAGHVHGGVIRLPFLGGLIGNDRKLFPEYSEGAYQLFNTTMYVSRGIGDTAIPRINNNPEVVCITLRHLSK